MDWSQMLQLSLFSLLCLTGSAKAVGDLCEDKGREVERVFSVSGDAAMLTSTLVDLNVFDYRSIPYNISWYDPRTGRELTRETRKTLPRGKTLWIFNIAMEDAGNYECVVRLPSQCYKKSALLIVNHTNPEECGRPEKADQVLTNKATGFLNCPLSDHIREVDNYSIQWYKGCEPIVKDDPLWNRFSYVNNSVTELLLVKAVIPEDHAFYTCTMTFNLEGLSGRISETINGMVDDLCEDKGREVEQVFSVSGDAAMLTSTLVDLNVFDNSSIPYNISWYDPRTGRELTRETRKTLPRGKTLWIFNIAMEDAGNYECVVRLPSQCYKKSALLIVNHTNPEECGRPEKADQVLTNKATGFLNCPLSDHIREVDNYSIQWYKGCEPIVKDDPLWNRFSYVNNSVTELLHVKAVIPEDHAFYTCTMTFNLEGLSGRISETINGMVDVQYCLEPKVVEPANEIIKADLGSSFSKMCRVFVPSVGNKSCTDLNWKASKNSISKIVSERIFQESQREWREEEEKGVWLERHLNFLMVEEEDFYINYTCLVSSERGISLAFFILQPTDPNYLLPIGVLLTSLVLVFTVSVVIYHRFKIDIVLSLRRMFPLLYTNTDSDGKLYDAYVAYPRLFGDGGGACGEAEMFALHMLPQVLEGRCGYRLFILGRDSLPGEAIVDAVEESMLASRRLLLVYSGSTFCSGSHSDSSSGVLEAWQSFERQTAMHRALLEGSLKVVLVELEEVSPTQLTLFPESVRHLRERQGAVCWWKSSRGLRCGRWGEEEEVEEKRGELASSPFSSPSLSLSSRFWKELRYYMPVRGTRTR